MEIDSATFSPWSFDEQMKNKRHGLKSETRQRFTILKKAEIIETFLQMKESDSSLSQFAPPGLLMKHAFQRGLPKKRGFLKQLQIHKKEIVRCQLWKR